LIIDSHTHTLASGHAYSTITECAREAAANGVRMFAMTDHGPAMQGASDEVHFWNLKAIPGNMYGIRIIKGAEANILDYDGKLDIQDKILKRLEFVIAGLHDVVLKPGTEEENTRALVEALKNPLVDTVAHPGNPVFPVDIDTVVKTAVEYGKPIEINNHSFISRKGSSDRCREFIRSCVKYGAMMVCGSDAHFSFGIGKMDIVKTVLEEEKVPEELVLSTSVERFEQYLVERKNRLDKA